MKEMDAIMYADAAKEVHRHILRGGELFDPLHIGPTFSPEAESEEEEEGEDEEAGGTEEGEAEEKQEDKSQPPTPAVPADLLASPATPAAAAVPAAAAAPAAAAPAAPAAAGAAAAPAATTAAAAPAAAAAAAAGAAAAASPPSSVPPSRAAAQEEAAAEEAAPAEGATAAGVELTPVERRFSAGRGYMMRAGGAGLRDVSAAPPAAAAMEFYEPTMRLPSSVAAVDMPYSRSGSFQASVLLGEGEPSPVMGPLVPLEHLNVALPQPHADEASAAAAAAAAGSTESSIAAARELLLGGGRSSAAAAALAAAAERSGAAGGSFAAASFIAGHAPSAASSFICPAATAEAEAAAAAGLSSSHLSAVVSRRASLYSETGEEEKSAKKVRHVISAKDSKRQEGPPRLFQSYQDLVNFDVALKHQTPIGQYEFQFLDEMEAHDAGDPNWELVVDQKMIRVFKFINPNSPVVLVKAYAQVEGVPIQVLCHHIRDMPTRQKWDTTFEDYRVIEANVEHNEIIYSMMKAPFPVSNRDFLQWRRTEVDMNAGLIKILMRSAEHPSMPERPGVIRAETIISAIVKKICPKRRIRNNVYAAGYKMRRTEGDSSSLFILAQTDVKGLIPKWLVNTTAARAPVGWVESLRKVCLAYMKKHNGEVPAATLLSS